MAKKTANKSFKSKVEIVSDGDDLDHAQLTIEEDQVELIQCDEKTSSDEGSSELRFPNFGDRYEVVEIIAEGGMGSVYKAIDNSTGKILAIKTLPIDLANDAVALKKFEREAHAATKLNHPNLVAVFEHGTMPSGAPFIVMDFIEGESLAEVLKREGALEPERASNIFMQIAEGLLYAHENDLIHRDVKPSNVILTKTESGEIARLVDFGIAMAVPSAGRETRDLTQTGEVFGSPHYMSPEQCLGFMIDRRSDIYSFGCLMYESLTGNAPFGGSNPIQLVVKHINEDAKEFPRDLKTGKLIDKLEAITFRCLEKTPDLRFQTVTDLLFDLQLAKDGKPLPRYSKAAKRRPSLTKKQAIGALAIVCMALLYVPSLPLELIPLDWQVHIRNSMYMLVCMAGIYTTFTAGLDRLKNIRQPKLTQKQWLITFALFGIALTGFGLMFDLLKYVIYGYKVAPNWFAALEVWADFIYTTAGTFAVACVTLLPFSRSANKISYGSGLQRVIITAAIIFGGMAIVFPDKMANGFYGWALEAKRPYPELSINVFKLVYMLNNKNVNAIQHIARIQQRKKDFDGAIETLSNYIDKAPDAISSVYFIRSDIYIEAGKLDEAEADANHIIQSDRDGSAEAYQFRGNIKGLSGNFLGALEDFKHSLTLEPRLDNPSYGSRTAMYCRFSKFDEALKDLEDRRFMRVDETKWYTTRALIYEKLGRIDDAKADYKMVVQTYEDLLKQDEKERRRWQWHDDEIFLSAFAQKKLSNEAEFNRMISKLNNPDDWKEPDSLSDRLNMKYSKLDFSWKPLESH